MTDAEWDDYMAGWRAGFRIGVDWTLSHTSGELTAAIEREIEGRRDLVLEVLHVSLASDASQA